MGFSKKYSYPKNFKKCIYSNILIDSKTKNDTLDLFL